MSVSQKFKSDAHIHARRELEFKERIMFDAIKGDKNSFLKAKWEHKTDNIIVKYVAKTRIAALRSRQVSNLYERRQKLAVMLASEDQLYEQEFMQNLETPEQVRAQMHIQLEGFQAQRAQEKKQLCDQARARKFKMETDDLRREETRFMNAGCQLEREKQLMDKRQKLEDNIVEEQVYAKLWMLDRDKKIAREQFEAEENRKKVHETLNVLSWQNDAKTVVSQDEQAKKLVEQSMLKVQWSKEVDCDKEAERQKFILNRERNLELISHNAAERELQSIQIEAGKKRDKELLEAALAKEKAMINLEEAERIRRRQEIMDLQVYYKKTKEDANAYERLVDEVVAQEAERQTKMRDAQWQREEQARINLLKDVYISREKDILLKQERKREDHWFQSYEKNQIETGIAQQNAEYEARAATEAARRKNHQMDILKQMNEKDRIQRQYLQEKMYEERAAKLAELEYQRKINQDKEQNATMLSQWKDSVKYN